MSPKIKKLLPMKYRPEVWAHSHCDILSQVIAGPFTGLKYPDNEERPYYSARLLGTYERELHTTIEELCLCQYSTVIDVGAAEGYYAIGFCKRCPQIHMIAFEAEEYKRIRLKEMAEINKVQDRLTIGGLCSTDNLRDALKDQKNVLIVCDIEGGERDLLDPVEIPDLLRATLLVELHDVFPEFADVPSVMRERFGKSHDIREVVGCDRTLKDLPFSVPYLFRKFYWPRLMARMDEKRPQNMHWYVMKPLSKSYN